MRRGCAVPVLLGVLAVVLFVVLALAGDRLCGTNKEGIRGQYEPPLGCFYPEGVTVG